MTEAIKQWMEKEADDFSTSAEIQEDFEAGLTKGIEIAEGFAVWVEKFTLPAKEGFWLLQGEDGVLTTSQLLEKYLETLNKDQS